MHTYTYSFTQYRRQKVKKSNCVPLSTQFGVYLPNYSNLHYCFGCYYKMDYLDSLCSKWFLTNIRKLCFLMLTWQGALLQNKIF